MPFMGMGKRGNSMEEMISASAFFGVALSLGAYLIGLALQSKFKKGIFNPLLISIMGGTNGIRTN